MSYDIFLRAEKCHHCGQEMRGDTYGPDLPEPTYNLTPIFDLALTGEPLPNPDVGEAGVVFLGHKTDRPRGLRVLSGRKASETIEWLRKACAHLERFELAAEFRKLEPENKWGTLEDAREVMRRLLKAAEDWPDRTWEIR